MLTKNSIFKPEKQFQFHPDFINWDGVTYTEETIDGKRHYTIDGVNYPSITTVLSYDPLKIQILKKWEKRVGTEAAKEIRRTTSIRGKSLHKICENFIGKNEVSISTYEEKENFFKVKGVIERNIGKIYCIENALYSYRLGVAGRVDLIAEWWNSDSKQYEPAVIDFKTSTKTKYRQNIYNYFIQGTAYAEMFRDMTGISIPKVIVVMATEELNDAQVFEEKTENWIDPLGKAIITYKENVNVQKNILNPSTNDASI